MELEEKYPIGKRKTIIDSTNHQVLGGPKTLVFGGGFKRSFSLLFFCGSAGFQWVTHIGFILLSLLWQVDPQMKKNHGCESQVGLSSEREKTWKPTRVFSLLGLFSWWSSHPIGLRKRSTKTTPLSQNNQQKLCRTQRRNRPASTGKIPKDHSVEMVSTIVAKTAVAVR